MTPVVTISPTLAAKWAAREANPLDMEEFRNAVQVAFEDVSESDSDRSEFIVRVGDA
jgi:hypothetical protein